MRNITLLISVLCMTNGLYAQQLPSVFIDDLEIHDVILDENGMYYATDKDIFQIDDENNKTKITNTSWTYINGKFQHTAEGWVYMGWEFLDVDVVLPNAILRYWDGEDLVTKFLNLLNYSYASHIAMSYHSMDFIYILAKDFDGFRIFRLDDDGNVLEDVSLDLNNLVDMDYLTEGTNLLVGKKALYTLEGTGIKDDINFEETIITHKVYPQEEKIEILTKSEILVLDYNLNPINTVPLPQSDRETTSFFTKNGLSYIVEVIDNQSYVTTLNETGDVLDMYMEGTEIKYNDLLIEDGGYHIWGNNQCGLSGNLLKVDSIEFQSEIPYSDMSIEEFSLNYEGEEIDTVVLNSGDSIYVDYTRFTWIIEIENKGDNPILNYEVNSTKFGFGGPPYINFTSELPLTPGDIRTHQGELKLSGSQLNPGSGIWVWMGSDGFDDTCADNSSFVSIPTSTDDDQLLPLKIYPNPATEIITIDLVDKYNYRIYDMTGQLQMKKNDCRTAVIDIAELEPGVFFIELSSNGVRFQEKFIKL